jgi:hypothetical protein
MSFPESPAVLFQKILLNILKDTLSFAFMYIAPPLGL